MEASFDGLLDKVRLRFRVLDGTTVLSDRLVSHAEASQAAEDQSTVARAALERGLTVTLLVTDPDEDDRVIFRAAWEP
jgi:hypothetical protein